MIETREDKALKLINKKRLTNRDKEELIRICAMMCVSRDKMRRVIVQVSFRLCDRVQGKRKQSDYTVEDFANDIGIKYKTLWLWRKEEKCIYSKVKETEVEGLKRKQIERILGKVKEETPAREVRKIIKQETSLPMKDRELVDRTKRISNIKFAICHKYVLDKLDQKQLKLFHTYVKEMDKTLTDHFAGKKKVNVRLRKQKEAIATVRKVIQ